MPATSASIPSGFPARTIRASATSATRASPSSGSAARPPASSASSATATAGTRSSATSAPTRSRTNITKIKGQHDFRGGYFLNFLYLDHWQPETGNPRGQFDFLPNTTGLHGGQTANFYNAYAAFLLGPGRAGAEERAERADDRRASGSTRCTSATGGRPSAKLTLDLGLRWELYPIMHRAGWPRHRSSRPRQPRLRAAAGRDHRRTRQQPADQRDEHGPQQLRPASRRRLPDQRRDGLPSAATA